MYGRHNELQNTKQDKKTLANAPRHCFVSSSTKGMIGISSFLEMKIESEAFKVYTSNSCDTGDCSRAELGKTILDRNEAQLTLSPAFLEVCQNA